jgi:hypothetical protein
VRSLRALTSLELRYCDMVTDEGVRAVSSSPALTSLDLACCFKLTDEEVRAISAPRLTFLNLNDCLKLACRRSAAPPPPLACTSSGMIHNQTVRTTRRTGRTGTSAIAEP